jgi:hypothetical protein
MTGRRTENAVSVRRDLRRGLSGCLRRSFGDFDPKATALSRQRIEANAAIEEFDDALDHGQADARARIFMLSMTSLEDAENLFAGNGSDPDSVVADRDANSPPINCPDVNFDVRRDTGRDEFQRVGDQVLQACASNIGWAITRASVGTARTTAPLRAISSARAFMARSTIALTPVGTTSNSE